MEIKAGSSDPSLPPSLPPSRSAQINTAGAAARRRAMTAYRTALMPDMKQRLSVTSGRPARDSCEDVNFMTSPEKGEKKKKKKTFPLVCAATRKYRNTPEGEIDFTQVLPWLVTDMRPLKISPQPALDSFRAPSPVRAHSHRG